MPALGRLCEQLGHYAATIASTPLIDTSDRIGFVSQLDTRALAAIFDFGAAGWCAVEMHDQGSAA